MRAIFFLIFISFLSSACQKGAAASVDTTENLTVNCTPSQNWNQKYLGIEKGTSRIPAKNLINQTLRDWQNHVENADKNGGVETLGVVGRFGNSRFVRGKLSYFGGPSDHGVGPNEKGAITGEVLRKLNNPENPTLKYLKENLEKYYFVAMRFDYTQNGRNWWARQRILIMNPKNGRAVIVRPVDWGPHPVTGRVIDLSMQSQKDLKANTDQEVLIAFAPENSDLGPAQLCDPTEDNQK